jgi:hypothetical protein
LRWPLIDKDDARDCLQQIAEAGAAAAATAATATGVRADAPDGRTHKLASDVQPQQQPQPPQVQHHPHQPQQQQQQQQQQQEQEPQGTGQRQWREPPPQTDWNALSYDLMFKFLNTQLSLGLCAVADCPFSREGLYRRAEALARQASGGAAG